MPGALQIGVAGAGAIGFFVGGRLAQAGHKLHFLARPRLQDEIAQNGLRLTDFENRTAHLQNLNISADPSVLSGCDIILVTVKSAATADMAQEIAAHVSRGACVISLQNGVTNAAALMKVLPGYDVRAGMVPFNVTQTGPGAFHRGTSGDILIAKGPADLPNLNSAGLTWKEADQFEAVQWGKLLINLNNALNALSDLPLLTQLQDRAWRRLMAQQMQEALQVMRAANITPARFTVLPPTWVPHVLRLPTPVFRRIAAQMLTIDPQARSSMWDDLTLRRHTEIDALQGAVLAVAQEHGVVCPLMERVVAAVRAAELAGSGPPGLAPHNI